MALVKGVSLSAKLGEGDVNIGFGIVSPRPCHVPE